MLHFAQHCKEQTSGDEEFEVKEILKKDFIIEEEMKKVRAHGNQRRLLLANAIHSLL